jgi:hypothetical protein
MRGRLFTEDPRYEDGAHFWRDTAMLYGRDEALGICGRYLDTQLKIELPGDEKQFCRELFSAMYEASMEKTDPAKLVYPYNFQKANDRIEASYYHQSRSRNEDCARAIDEAVRNSCYKVNYYNLNIAAMKVIHDYGFARVNLVLAYNFQQHEYDGRYSSANKRWAQDFAVPEKAFGHIYMNAHPILIEDFANHARKLYEDVGAERFALPGHPESGTVVHGYEITRAIFFDDQRGFAIGLNPYAPSNFVSWQFTVENGKRDFYWGDYNDGLAGAADNYIARIIVHMNGGDVKEIPSLDLTDGQTDKGTRGLAPEKRPSTLAQIREAKLAPKQPRKAKTPGKNKSDIEI